MHGIDIGEELSEAIDAWNVQDYETAGFEIGQASLTLLQNKKMIDMGKDPNQVDAQKAYFLTMGAEFAAGLYFGANVGAFDEMMILNCLYNEPTA